MHAGAGVIFFPFLMAEVKSGEPLDIANRQNLYSAATAVRGILELFSLVNKQQDLNGEILAFTVSHNEQQAIIRGYYPVIDGNNWEIYSHTLARIDLYDPNSHYKTYQFIMQMYEFWMPTHLNRLRSTLADYSSASFEVSDVSWTSEAETPAEKS